MSKYINKISLLCVLILLITQESSYAQEAVHQKQAAESPFVLRVAYKNYGKKSKHLVKVGVKVSNLNGRIICAGMVFDRSVGSYFSEVLQPQANYIINLHVSNDETIIDADPPIAIKPDEASSFTISFFPSIVGSCTELISFEVSGILIFDDGEKVYFTPKQNRITGEEVSKFIQRTPDEQELLTAINNRNIGIRRQAFSHLSKSTLDSESIKFLISQGLTNEDPGIRAASAISASKLGYKMYTKQIISLLKNSLEQLDAQAKLTREKASKTGVFTVFSKSKNEEEVEKILKSLELDRLRIDSQKAEIADYCIALGGLQDSAGIDVLISTLNNLNFEYPEKVSDALVKLNHPDVVNKVRPLLLRNIELSPEKDYRLIKLHREIVKILVAYRDMKSVESLLNFAEKSPYILSTVVYGIGSTINENQIIRDPFILAMRPALENALRGNTSQSTLKNAPGGNTKQSGLAAAQATLADAQGSNTNSWLQIPSLKILSLMPLNDNLIESYFRTVFKDDDFNNRVNAAALAADRGYKSLAGEIVSLLKSSKSEWEKERYCQALAKLGMPCK